MAHVEDRWYRTIVGPDDKPQKIAKARCGKGRRYRVRYLDPSGAEKSKTFTKKIDADGFKIKVEGDLQRGLYVDPDAGRVTFEAKATEVFRTRTLDPGTRDTVLSRLRNHVFPVIGRNEIGYLSQRPSTMQALINELAGKGLAPTFVNVIMSHVHAVFGAAVDDHLVAANPCDAASVKAPAVPERKVVPWTAARVFAVQDALPEHLKATVDCGSGLGMRQGEFLALSPDDIDWLKNVVHVKRQVKVLKNRLVFSPPKRGKTRDVPLPESVKLALAEHIRKHGPVAVTLPWRTLDGADTTVRLMFTTRAGTAIHRDLYNRRAWRPALEKAHVPAGRENGTHALRHHFASVLLDGGESIKNVSAWLGHASAGFTLKTYTHLIPASEQRMRKVIDAARKRPENPAHGPEAARGQVN